MTYRFTEQLAATYQHEQTLSFLNKITAAIFIVDWSPYDPRPGKEKTEIILEKAYKEFEEVVNSPLFQRTPIVFLIHNMWICNSRNRRCPGEQPCFDCDGIYDRRWGTILDRFLSQNKQPKRIIDMHVMSNEDFSNTARDIILNANLRDINVGEI